jgi:cyclophilin family peptidyl-prolyl cis-trans isomerase
MATNNIPNPIVTNPIDNQIVNIDASDTTLDLSSYFDDPLTTGKVAHFNLADTSVGTIGNGVINVVLFDQTGNGAPLTVENFQSYADAGSYTNSFIHRSIPDFIVQGGGFTYNDSTLLDIPSNAPVQNEFSTDRSNLRGTIAMAKLGNDPDSATNQWFFNLADNSSNLDNQNGGFTVFGQAISDNDLETIDAIASVPIYDVGGVFTDLPLTAAAISDTNFVRFSSITVTQEQELQFSIVDNSKPTLVTPSISNQQLLLDYLPNQTGTANITIRATNLFDQFVDYQFTTTVLPTISLGISTSSVSEDSADNLIYTFTRNGDLSTTLTTNYNIAGTATFDTDYAQIGADSFTPTTGTITFAANSATATLTIDPTPDTTIESDETIALTLATGTDYAIETNTAVTGTITNDDVPFINQIPTLNAIANPAEILEDAVTQTISLSEISAGIGENQNLTITATSNNPTLIANPTVNYTSPNATGSLSYIPIANQSGSALITVTIKDDGGTENGGIDTTTKTFTINVNPVNDPVTGSPTAVLATGTEDTLYSIQTTSLLEGFEDVDIAINDQSLSVVNLVANNGTLVNHNNGTYDFTPTANHNGLVTLTYDVTDSSGSTLTGQTRTFNLAAVNDAPLLENPLVNQTANIDSSFTFTIPENTFTDVDIDDILSYLATQTDGNDLPSWLIFNTETRTFSGTPTNNEVGSLHIKVTATDTAGATANGDFTITVNHVPKVANPITNQTATEDTNFSFTIPENTFTDTDDTLTYFATQADGNNLPSWLVFNPETRTFSGTPTNHEVGSLNIKVTATDTAGETANNDFTIIVNNTNDAPILENAIADQTATENTEFNFTFDANTFIDIDPEDHLSYSATLEDDSNLPIWLNFNPTTRTFSGTPTNTNIGNLPIQIRATDNDGLIATDTFLLTVAQINSSPNVNLTKISDDIFNLSNSSGKSKIKITLTERNSNLVNELGLFTVDDSQGNINGIAPGATGYTQAALERSQVILSAITNIPNGFNTDNLTHLLEFDSGENLRFYLVKNSTTDSVKAGITPVTDILFSDPLNQEITDLGNNEFSLSWKDGSNNNATDFSNLVVKFSSTNDSLALGTNLQGKPQGEVIDLRGITSQVQADFVVNREAAFNNFIGFYQVTDENGGIDTNGDGKADILVGDTGYTQTAISSRVAGIDLTVNNQGTANYTGTFQPGSIFVPFIIVNSQPNTLLDNNINNDPAVYFPFLGANADNMDHIRLLGNNVFGFEDLSIGGDNDFNDMIVAVKLTIV